MNCSRAARGMRFWWPNQTNGQTARAAAALPLDGQLVGLRPAELEDLGGLLDGHEWRKVVQHGARLLCCAPQRVCIVSRERSTVVKHNAAVIGGSHGPRPRQEGTPTRAPASKRPTRAAAWTSTRSSPTTSKAIRERRGWTQQDVAERLARLTGHRLPQASISAMERGFDGDRRRRFDAHELVPALGGVRRADRLLLHPAARTRGSRRAGRHATGRSSELYVVGARPGAPARRARRATRRRSTSRTPTRSTTSLAAHLRRQGSGRARTGTTTTARGARSGSRSWRRTYGDQPRRGRRVPRRVRQRRSRRSARRATCRRWPTSDGEDVDRLGPRARRGGLTCAARW